MKYYGDIQLNQNEIQQAVLQTEFEWPTTPKVGQIAFINKVVYICVQITDNVPIWVPMTNTVSIYVHVQDVSATTWNITHDLNTTFVLVQIFDGNNQMVIPNSVTINSASSITVTFTSSAAGRAVIITGSLDGAQQPVYALEWNQTTPASNWVIDHNLGYQPIVRVFSGSYEIQPASIFFNSMNRVTISFTQPEIGIAKLI
jgi:hypothetical protein